MNAGSRGVSNMVRLGCSASLAILLSSVSAFADGVDVVHLKNGGRVQGVVIEDDPAAGATVRLGDGTTKKIPKSAISSIDYAPPAAVEPPAPAPVVRIPQPAQPTQPMRRRAPHRTSDDSEDDGTADPDTSHGGHIERRSLKGLWVTGLVIDLSVWALRAGVTAGMCASYSAKQHGCNGLDYGSAAIPVVGAWIQVSRGADPNQIGVGGFAANVFAGILEAGGFVMLVVGLSVKHKVIVNGPETDSAMFTTGPFHWRPTLGAGSGAIVGSF